MLRILINIALNPKNLLKYFVFRFKDGHDGRSYFFPQKNVTCFQNKLLSGELFSSDFTFRKYKLEYLIKTATGYPLLCLYPSRSYRYNRYNKHHQNHRHSYQFQCIKIQCVGKVMVHF